VGTALARRDDMATGTRLDDASLGAWECQTVYVVQVLSRSLSHGQSGATKWLPPRIVVNE